MSTIESRKSSLDLQNASLNLEGRQYKFIKFEKFAQAVFSYLFTFFDAESIVHFQRGSNKQIFEQCSLALHQYLGKITVLKYCDMHLIRAIRPHPIFWGDTKGNFLVSREQKNNFGHLIKATSNVAFLDFSKLPVKNYLNKIVPYIKELQKLSGISFAGSCLTVTYVSEILKSEGLQDLTSLDVSSTTLGDDEDLDLAEFIASRFPKLEYLNLNSTDTHKQYYVGMGAISKNCKNLKSLKIANYLITAFFARYLSECSLLTELDITVSKITFPTNMQKIFSSCKNITSLTLSCFDFEKETLQVIGNECKNLKILNMGYLLTFLNLQNLVRCTNLQEIYVSTLDMDNSVIDSLKLNLPSLRKFYIYKVNFINQIKTQESHYILDK